MIYKPREDSYFLSELVEDYLNNIPDKEKREMKVMDMGTGSGIQVETLIEKGVRRENILAIDIDKSAVEKVRKKVRTIQSDLFKNVEGSFDLIVFNPPYLPSSEYDNGIDTTGGEKGDEVLTRFIKNLGDYLKKNGEALILLSSLTPRYNINKTIERKGFKKKKVGEKILFFESLEVWKISANY